MDIASLFSNLSNSDWIDIINILVTSIIGIWIGLVVQRNLTTNRAVKEYFISEISAINSTYMAFLNNLYKGNLSSRNIQEWLKIMNIRIEIVEESIQSRLKVKSLILSNHIKLKQFVTSLEEFNNSYANNKLMLSVTNRNELLEMNRCLKNSFVKIVVDINKASTKGNTLKYFLRTVICILIFLLGFILAFLNDLYKIFN